MAYLSCLPLSMSLTSSLMEIRAFTKRSSSACRRHNHVLSLLQQPPTTHC